VKERSEFFFTICSNNYLAQAIVLGNSLKAWYPQNNYVIFLVDERNKAIDYTAIPFEILPVKEIEPGLQELVHKYNIVELNTCVKPRVIEYLFQERNADRVIYFDPDIRIYHRLEELEKALDENNIVLTPHIFTPIPLDGKLPNESNFLNYGIYNLGFIALNRNEETEHFVGWWKERTYKIGYSRVEEGLFVDQLFINLVPIFYKLVHILQHRGYNMAPWNLHERYLTQQGDAFYVKNGDALRFFHFSSFRLHSDELPLHYYNRFQLKDRPDLHAIYSQYNSELDKAGHSFYSKISCAYVTMHEQFVLQTKKNEWRKKSLLKKIPLSLVRMLPQKLKTRLSASLTNN
jgi:hypothetical protein